MKNKITLPIVLMTVSLFTATISKAAFPIKKDASPTAVTQQPASSSESGTIASASGTATSGVVTANEKVANIKDYTKTTPEERYIMPLALYIILAIFWLGWLAMGLNDNFRGWPWLVSLLLYILFYFPGLIFTLIEIPLYY